jgi:6-pyruvoyltetrahydropterin/6-carboxytetrahydropterin synthase
VVAGQPCLEWRVITITRRLEFDYGHRVLGHEGKCKHLHGHHGVAEITIQAPELDAVGRVVDFGVVKILVGGWLDSNWDHQLLLNSNDPQLPYLRNTEDRAPYSMKGNPTAENMAKELFGVCIELLASHLKVVGVRIYETPNCWADYYE